MSTVQFYDKPDTRPQPILLPAPTVDEIKPNEGHLVGGKLLEIVYGLARSGVLSPCVAILPWGACHASLAPNNLSVTDVAYSPILQANPTHHDTIYTTLLRAKEISNSLRFQNTPIVFDMGLLTKALEITSAIRRSNAG